MAYRYSYQIVVLIAGVVFLFARTGQSPVAAAHTEPALAEAIDSYVTEQMEELEIPGVAVGVVRGDQVLHLQGYGVADDAGRTVTPQTPFLIASLSKSFTALGILQLVEVGKLELDVPVQNYLPWFQVADGEASSRITIRHLLNQTSGFSEREGYVRNLDANPTADALEASIRLLSQSSLESPPGTMFEYSNTNYDILGLVIQEVSGQTYESYVQEKIFDPLGMINSYPSLSEARNGNMTSGYYSFFSIPVAYDRWMPYSRTVLPSAGLFSSAEDMTYYLIAQLNEGRYQGTSILSPDGIAQLHAPAVRIDDNASYAMGWVVFPFADAVIDAADPVPTAVSHGGAWVGYQATTVLIPERDLGVVVLANQSDPDFYNLGWNISLLALGLEPRSYPTADFTTRYGLSLLAGVVLLLGAALFWSWRKIRSLSAQKDVDAKQRRKLLVQVSLLALVDLVLAGWLLFIKLPQDNNTLALALRFTPDVGLMYILLLVLTLGWGFFHTGLFVHVLSKKGNLPQGQN